MTDLSPLALDPLMGISWPRSGHHLLVRLLQNYFGPQFGYCEYHKAPPSLSDLGVCCRQVPCRHFGRIHFTKNHDFDLNVPQIEGHRYLIQYRDFVPSAVSNFELFVRTGGQDTALAFRRFASNQFSRYLDFTDKWVTSDFAKSQVVLHYADLTNDPHAALAHIVSCFDPSCVPDSDRIDKAIKTVDGQKIERAKAERIKGAGVHTARDVQGFRFYAPQLFETLGALCLRREDVMQTFLDVMERKPAEPNILKLQCQPDIDTLGALLRAAPEYLKKHGTPSTNCS